MRVQHLNCATLCPRGGRLVNGDRAPCAKATLVCHVLLVESSRGLVLVDTGLGLDDVHGRRGALYTQRLRLLGAGLDPQEPAAVQVARLGHSLDDVRHVVLTHLDLDHCGGLADFPRADVHVLAREHEAAMLRRTLSERSRYQPVTWRHRPRWVLHHPDEGDRWFGFASVRAIGDLPPELLMLPLHGHTRGHAGVAVETPEGWLLHAGDAYFFEGETDPVAPRCTPGLDVFQRLVAIDDVARRANQERLRALRRAHGDEVRIFSAHDPAELAAFPSPAPAELAAAAR